MNFRNKVKSWILRQFNLDPLSAELKRRGWSIIRTSTLKKHFPDATGFWPVDGDDDGED